MLNKKNNLGVAAGIAALVLTASAYATTPGAYVGGQLGLGDIHQSGISQSDLTGAGMNYQAFGSSSKDSGLAGRLFAGYQFDENWAAELGYTKFTTMETSAYGHGTDVGTNFNVDASGKITAQSVDLVGKGILPLQDGFSVYGKLGVAYLLEKATVNGTATGNNNIVTGQSSTTDNSLLPTFGVGVAYDITPNVATDLSWNRIQKVGSTDDNSTDLVSLGLIYSFGG